MTLWLVLALVVSGSVEYVPANPTVGDLITVSFPDVGEGKLSLLPSDDLEVVDVSRGTAVVRTFRPGSLKVVAEILTPGEQTRRYSVEIDVRSVLEENDDLRPAPLVFPKELPPNVVARWAIGGAAAAVLLVWAFLYVIARRMEEGGDDDGDRGVDVSAAYLERLNRIGRLADEEERWRQLADSTRWLLPRIDPVLGPELTTSEVLEAMVPGRFDRETSALVARILHGGDWAKFSPFGAPDETIATLLTRARALASLARREEAT